MYEEYLPQKSALAAFPVGMAEHHLFCDYGFDPEIDYFQLQQKVIEDQQRRKRGNGRREARKAATEAVRFKLQKPISKDHSSSSGGKGKKRAKWWKNCIQFLKNKWTRTEQDPSSTFSSAGKERRICYDGSSSTTTAPSVHPPPTPAPTASPPLYTTDGSSLYRAPCRTTKRRFGSWTWSPLQVAEVPYHCLKDLGLIDDDNGGKKDHDRLSDTPSSHMSIYLVT